MNKKEKITKDNIVKFPSKLTDLEKEIEAVIFAAAEPQIVAKTNHTGQTKPTLDHFASSGQCSGSCITVTI